MNLFDTCITIRYPRTIGMFEQNNIGVRCQHPLAVTSLSLTPNSDQAVPILNAVKMIVDHLEGQYKI